MRQFHFPQIDIDTIGRGFIYDEAKDLPLCLPTRELIKESCAAKIKMKSSVCVLIEKTLNHIFSKI